MVPGWAVMPPELREVMSLLVYGIMLVVSLSQAAVVMHVGLLVKSALRGHFRWWSLTVALLSAAALVSYVWFMLSLLAWVRENGGVP